MVHLWRNPVRMVHPEGGCSMCLVGLGKVRLMCVLQAPDCRIVLLVGLSLMTVPVAVMCFFNDDRSLGESSEAKRYRMRFVEPIPLCPSCHHGLYFMLALPDCSGSLTNHCCPHIWQTALQV